MSVPSIASAEFFWGKPDQTDDGPAIPAKVKPTEGEQNSQQESYWSADVDLPDGAKFPLTASVKLTNLAGLASFASIDVGDPNAVALATITGVLKAGTIPQPKREVSLLDASGKLVTTTQTDSKGNYKFINVKPGSYTLSSQKIETRQKCNVQLEVEAGDALDVPLRLKI